MSETPSVQVVENWAELVGRIVVMQDSPQLPGFATAQIQVAESNPVPGYPNLFEWAKGQTLQLQVPAEKARELQLSPGDEIACRARLTGPNTGFVHPSHCMRR